MRSRNIQNISPSYGEFLDLFIDLDIMILVMLSLYQLIKYTAWILYNIPTGVKYF